MLFQWTHRDLHPNLRHATPVSSCWTISPSFRSGSRETRTHKRLLPPPVFKTGSSSGRMTSVLSVLLPPCARHTPVCRARLLAAGVGIEPTASWFRARRHYQQQLSRSNQFRSSRRETLLHVRVVVCVLGARGEGIEPSSPGSKPGSFAVGPSPNV